MPKDPLALRESGRASIGLRIRFLSRSPQSLRIPHTTTQMNKKHCLALSSAVLGAIAIASCASLGTPEDQQEAGTLLDKMSGYDQWAHFAGHEGIKRGNSPHGKFVRTFVNPEGAKNPSAPGYGSIIVKENYSSDDPASLGAMTVMQRIEGYDPDNGDWFWARYDKKRKLTHSGKVAFCADCHFDAGGDDFVFLND